MRHCDAIKLYLMWNMVYIDTDVHIGTHILNAILGVDPVFAI